MNDPAAEPPDETEKRRRRRRGRVLSRPHRSKNLIEIILSTTMTRRYPR